MEVVLGFDVGSVSTNIAVLDHRGEILQTLYLRTQGKPIQAVQNGLRQIYETLPKGTEVVGVGATGSGRQLCSVVVGADVVKNEITAHAVAALHLIPGVQTVLEIGGQDSKIIIIRNDIVVDFAMNTVCAAGTGSFLDQQAARLGIPIEEFGNLALKAVSPVRVAGRCAVFAESDMIHKQQTGHLLPDIVNGLCEALVRNYLNNVGKGKEIRGPILFQGGVAANAGIRRAFERALNMNIEVPKYFNVMGAIGAGVLALEEAAPKKKTVFRGFELMDLEFCPRSFECQGCPNLCEVIEISVNNQVSARWGDRCGKWSNLTQDQAV